jgi:nucleoside-diphosphate-sugar epimerase
MVKKILIIGGNGYIGSRLYDHLVETNHDVTNLDLCWFGQIYPETIVKDYKDLTKEELSEYSHIVLLAAHSSVSMCVDNLSSCFKNNVTNFINLIEKLDNQILIYASTCAIYGKSRDLVTEDEPIKTALNFYDYSMATREVITNLHPNKKLIGLRFGSVGGFSKSLRNENLVNSLTLASKNKSLTIANGEAMRSVLGISDVCRAIERIISEDTIKNRIYNITSVNDKIINFGTQIQRLTSSELTINESAFKTDYSFSCSSELFKNDYGFEFKDNIESLYNDIITNYDEIVFNSKRGKIIYE